MLQLISAVLYVCAKVGVQYSDVGKGLIDTLDNDHLSRSSLLHLG